jgi:hypothetical protein
MVKKIIIQKKKEIISKEDIRNRIEIAYKKLIDKDSYLLKIDANERSITHRLAIYLEEVFWEYDVDCEYNRDGLDPKKLINYKKKIYSDDTNGTTVYPDIIIHHRGRGKKYNFIVIEAKKYFKIDNSKTYKADKEKLGAYKKDLSYKYAYFVKFPVGKNFKDDKCSSIEEFIEER